jgi:hypothetical protein
VQVVVVAKDKPRCGNMAHTHGMQYEGWDQMPVVQGSRLLCLVLGSYAP